MNERRKTHWSAWITLLMPVGLFLLAWANTIGNQRLERIEATVISTDEKVFKHLTNDEIHTPKSLVITKPEFNIYREYRTSEIENLREDVKCSLNEIKGMIRDKNVRK